MSLIYSYNTSNFKATVTGHSTGSSYSGTITIPDTVDYDDGNGTQTYTVTAIGSYAFQIYFNLTGVTIGNNVTSIGKYAFKDCNALQSVTLPTDGNLTSIGDGAFFGSGVQSVTIPNSVTTIGKYTFYQCNDLTSVTIGDSVTSIGSQVFQYCSQLQSVTLPTNGNLTSIDYGVFQSCSALTSVTIPDSVTSIGSNAFRSCSALESVTLPTNVNLTSIGDSAFQSCTSLQSVTIPDSVTSIDVNTFFGCTQLQSVPIPDSVTSIGGGAFYDCSALPSVTIPDNVTSIGWNCFQGCTALSSMTIPDSVTSIGDEAFKACYLLNSVTFKHTAALAQNITFGTTVFQNINNNNNTVDLVLYANSVTLDNNTYTVDDTGATLSSGTFANVIISSDVNLTYSYNTSNLQATVTGHTTGTSYSGTIFIPDTVEYNDGNGTQTYNVTAIDDDAFKDYTNLTGVTIPDSVTSIGTRAFQDCSALNSVTFKHTAAQAQNITFGSNVFTGVSANDLVLYDTSVTLDGTVYTVGDTGATLSSGTFANVIVFIKIYFTYSYDTQNLQATVTGHATGTSLSDTIDIPNTVYNGGTTYNVTAIGDEAFKDYTNLTGVTIHDSVTSIGASAFESCSGLQSVTIPDSVTSIGASAFYSCSQLQSVTIGNSVTSINDRVFQNCSVLNNVTIPNTVTSIGIGVFQSCTSLDAITIGNSVQTIDVTVFRYCTALQSVTFPDSVTSIGEKIFVGCTGLQSVTLPTNSNFTTIGLNFFKGCTALSSVTLPNSVTSIGATAFQDCSALNSVTFKHTSAQAQNITFGTTVFLNINNNSNTVDLVLDSSQNSVTLDGTVYTVGDTGATLSGGTFANVISSTNICFPAGTVLSLDQGDVEIQNVDTKKHTLNGKPILFVTKTAPNKPDVVCFEKDAFAPNVPSQRFECSRAHGIEFDGVRKMAEDWVDADQIHFVPNTHKFLYCLLLETHEMMDVYNIKAETLNPVRKVAQMYFAQLRKENESC